MEQSIQKIKKIVDEKIQKNGLDSIEVIKWSKLLNKLIMIQEKLKYFKFE